MKKRKSIFKKTLSLILTFMLILVLPTLSLALEEGEVAVEKTEVAVEKTEVPVEKTEVPVTKEEPRDLPAKITALHIDPSSATILEDEDKSFRAYATFSDGRVQDVTDESIWLSANESILANYDDGDFYGASAGTTKISVAYAQPGSNSAPVKSTASVKVNASTPGPGPAPIGKPILNIRPNSYSIATGKGLQFSAILVSTGTSVPSETDVTSKCEWGITRSVAYQKGTGYFIGSSEGVASVYATYYDQNGIAYYDEAELRVKESEKSAELYITPSSASLYSDEDKRFTATLKYSDGTSTDVTDKCNWSVRNTKVASFSGSKLRAKDEGKTTVIAIYKYNGKELKDTSDLSVYERNTKKLTVTPSSSKIKIGDTVQFSAILFDSSTGKEKDVTNDATWTISKNIADNLGKGKFKANSEGSVSIQISYSSSSQSKISANTTLEITKKDAPAPTPIPTPSGHKEAIFTIGSKTYTLDGNNNTMDSTLYMKQGRIFLPQRYLAYSLGLSDNDILWNQEDKTVSFVKDSTIVTIKAGTPLYTVNGNQQRMDIAPEVLNGRLMCPARYVAEAMGSSVFWNPTTQKVTIK